METETIDLDDLSVILEDMYIDILKEKSTEDLSRKMNENVRENGNKKNWQQHLKQDNLKKRIRKQNQTLLKIKEEKAK